MARKPRQKTICGGGSFPARGAAGAFVGLRAGQDVFDKLF